MKNLQHKAVLVTGGSRGIGAAIALRLAHEGADVAFTYHTSRDKAGETESAIRESGGKALAIRADNADPLAVSHAVAETYTQFGRLDMLINNAGMALYGNFSDFTLEEFDRIIAVNVRAAFAASLAAVKYMGTGGRIIHIGSCQAEIVPGPGAALYAMSKSALIGLTKGMARDLGSRGITVNIVHPGPIHTDMNPKDGPSSDYQRSLMALPEYGTPEDVGALVAYLAGPESSFVTGAGFTIDGGTSI